MREFAVSAFRHLTGLLLLMAVASSAATAQTGRVSGTVRTPDGTPVAGVLVTLTADSSIATTRTDAAGTFRLTELTEVKHELRVRSPGFVPWVQVVDVRDGEAVSVNVILRPAAQLLDSVLVTAAGTGVFGVVGDIRTLAPVDSAVVQIVGFRGADTTSGGGQFRLDGVRGGRSYVVRISSPEYETRTVAITVPSKGGFELIAFLAPGVERRKNDDALWRDFDNRVHYGGNNAVLVTRADLSGAARSNVLSSLTLARPLLLKSMRLHPSALSDPMSPAYPCIFINGRLASRYTFLEHFNVGEIVAIETYGFGSLQYERLAGRLSSLPTRRPACGSMPRRQRSFRGPTNGSEGLHGASFGELTDRGMIAVVVIWLRQ